MEQTPGPTLPMSQIGVNGPADFDCAAAFKALQAAFELAMERRPDCLCESFYTFAGRTVRFRIVGRELAEQIGRPFAHLVADTMISPVSDLAIDLWDQEEAGISCWGASTPHDVGSRQPSRDEVLTISSSGRFVGHQLLRSRAWLDRQARHLIGWTRSASQLSLYERGKPFHPLLCVWYYDRDVQVIHAGLVSLNGKGVLLPGMGGVGKSTSAVACLCAGFDFLGDDYVGLQVLADGSFVGHSLYSSTWLEPDHMARFPVLPLHAIRGLYPWEDKSLILLSDLFPKRLERIAPIRVLALPRVVDSSQSRIRPASKGEGLREIAPTSLFGVTPRPGARGFKRLAQLVERIPSYWLELGRDLSQIPQRVEELLALATRS